MGELGFDVQRFGDTIRHDRSFAGYKNVTDFSDAIFAKTNTRISKDTLYRIEQGKQEPTVSQFIAMNLTLFGHAFPREQDISVYSCLSNDWREFDGSGRMPLLQRMNIVERIWEDHGSESNDGLRCVERDCLYCSIGQQDVFFRDDDLIEERLEKPFQVYMPYISRLDIDGIDGVDRQIYTVYAKTGEYYFIYD